VARSASLWSSFFLDGIGRFRVAHDPWRRDPPAPRVVFPGHSARGQDSEATGP
jgi:hypothetical protein